MKKKQSLEVQNITVAVETHHNEDYICLTDMLKAKDGDFFISDWLRNRNTLEFLGIWEELNNPDFNCGEFALIKSVAGLNSFKISVKEWTQKTGAIGLIAKAGRYGGTYAHRDIAFEFGTWISPVFKLYLIKEYQRLKAIESNQYNLEWNVRRILSKTGYVLQTDAVKNFILPVSTLPKSKQGIAYADEADILNLALFGCTAKEWRDANPERAEQRENIRDVASINELTILSYLESMNADMIKQGLPKQTRYEKLKDVASYQLAILNAADAMKGIRKTTESAFLLENIQDDEG
jgi:hypothetical protein